MVIIQIFISKIIVLKYEIKYFSEFLTKNFSKYGRYLLIFLLIYLRLFKILLFE